ncbi:MAG TPA: tetratricopeptide repeat protein [Pirellulales bacterium]|jgi:tetratricopeptide (TPR) repeat protein|nr:tetratricopeptide repeat protein [Pirellulales bacterium]
MVVLLCALIGRWVYQGWTGPLPELPFLALDGIDPEVAEVLTKQRAAVERAPRSADAWGTLAMLLHAHQFADEAIICYGAAATLEKTNPNWPYFQGYLLEKGAHPDQALPCLERAAALAPNDLPVPRFRLADLLLSLGRIEDAETEYRKVLATKSDNKYVHFYSQFGLAQVMIARQNYQDALSLLQAIADDPYTRKRACALRAAVYERLGKRPESDREHVRFATLPEDQSWPDGTAQIRLLRVGWHGRILRANAMQNDNQPADALQLMIETVEKYPHTDQVWAALGVAKENMKDFAGAEEAYRKSIVLAPDRADHRFEFGDFLQARKRYKEAAAVFREAIELRPFDAATQFRLGACLQSLGDNPGAADAYRNALRYNPDLNDARQGLEMVTTKK